MPRFMLALYDDPSSFANLGPEEIQQVIQAYNAWAENLGRQGKLAGGDKLKDGGGRVMRGAGTDLTVRDGPYSETKEILGGYFLIDADSYDEVQKLCSDCPHLKYGGTIEVRELDPMGT